jgi:hypothetical protein
VGYKDDHLASGHPGCSQTEFTIDDGVDFFERVWVFERNACRSESNVMFASVLLVFLWIPIKVEHALQS